MRGSLKVVKLTTLLACAAFCGVAMADSTQVRVAGDTDATTGKVKAVVRTDQAQPAAEEAKADRGEPKVDLIIERYPNRQIKISKHVIRDGEHFINHGDWTMWDPHGNVIANGQFEYGRRQGTWSRLQSQATEHFSSPLYRGFERPFVWETAFKDDVLHGVWKIADADGRPVRLWRFDHGRLDGAAVVWWPSGKQRHEITYRQGIPHGDVRAWDAAGKLTGKVTFVDGRRKRRFVERYPGGHLAVEGTVRGAREMARSTFNWWEGTVHTDLIASQEREVRHGTWTYYHPNGKRQYVGRFEVDTPVGRHTWWHASGRRSMQGTFADGKEQGQWVWWHENGQKRQSGVYIAGDRVGEWVTWNTTGKVASRRDFSRAKQTPERAAPPDAVVNSSKPTTSRKTADGEARQPSPRVARTPRGPLSRQKQEALPEILKKWRSDRGTRLR